MQPELERLVHSGTKVTKRVLDQQKQASFAGDTTFPAESGHHGTMVLRCHQCASGIHMPCTQHPAIWGFLWGATIGDQVSFLNGQWFHSSFFQHPALDPERRPSPSADLQPGGLGPGAGSMSADGSIRLSASVLGVMGYLALHRSGSQCIGFGDNRLIGRQGYISLIFKERKLGIGKLLLVSA